MSDFKQWYIVYIYLGFEEWVKEMLKQCVEVFDMVDFFGEVCIFIEMIVEFKGGKKKEMQCKFFFGYILVEMEMSDVVWYVVKNMFKVMGFVGIGKKLIFLDQEEVDQIVEQVVIVKEKLKLKYMFG